MAEVTTTGSGVVRQAADRATLSVAYRSEAANRTRAVEELTARIAGVEEALERPGLRVAGRNLEVHDRWKGNRRSGAEAVQRYEIRVKDLDLLEDLIGALISREPSMLFGPNWELSDRAGAVREAQHKAVADARTRAEGYAAALGIELGDLVRIGDNTGDHGIPLMRSGGMAAYASAEMGQPDIAELNLTPELVDVEVICAATWQLSR